MLPNADQAVIDAIKLHGYLLSTSHPIGRFKAAFFAKLGYTSANWQALDSALREQHLTQRARPLETTGHGQKYEIRAILSGPAGESAVVVSVWMVRAGEERASIRDGLSRRRTVTFKVLDVVVLNRDLPRHSLKRGDLGAVVEVFESDALEVEFVTASGKTEALVTLDSADVRSVEDRDLVAVRPYSRTA
jgi:hypothetical protein